mmetsp:Transcript_103420/g.183338  ORF Transcript_103420/g.183338 Transcript_103420/m.183338 type:complete len:246 (-) Transcript_103420:402-1139(-)
MLAMAGRALANVQTGMRKRELGEEEAIRQMLQNNETKTMRAYRQAVEDRTPVPMLVVHVESSELVPNVAGSNLRLKVQYGVGENSQKKCSNNTTAIRNQNGKEAFAPLKAALMFPWRDDFEPTLKLSLQKVGSFCCSTLSEVRLNLPFRGRPGVKQEDVLFWQGSRPTALDPLGEVSVHVELCLLPRKLAESRVLLSPHLLPHWQEASNGPVLLGSQSEDTKNKVVQGEPLSGNVVQGRPVSECN